MSMIHDDLPLIDLHRHLDGNLRLATILDLARQHDLPLPANTLEELRPHIQVSEPETDIMAYFTRFNWMISVLADYDACRRVAYENVLDAAAEGLDYIELRFSPGSWRNRTNLTRPAWWKQWWKACGRGTQRHHRPRRYSLASSAGPMDRDRDEGTASAADPKGSHCGTGPGR